PPPARPLRLESSAGLSLASIHENFVQYFTGAWLLAAGAAVLAGAVTFVAQLLVQRKQTYPF
ncbi:MAG: hypothetical protein M3Y54_22045, partial [Bacteroidota bacterium]|nr:hypothetical protein [Bacteroidota bacterium]